MECSRTRWWLLLLAVSLALPSLGCVGLLANLLYEGHMAPAACDDLIDRRVAVVCVSSTGAWGPSSDANILAGLVARELKKNVKKIRVVDQQKIEEWTDNNDWDRVDYLEIGRGVNAEMVLAIDLDSLSFQEGQTLYKGHADIKLSVYDMTKGGEVVYSTLPTPYIYPRNAGYAADGKLAAFRAKFLRYVAADIAKNFHPHDAGKEYGIDTAFVIQ